jgi:hypothetical protein
MAKQNGTAPGMSVKDQIAALLANASEDERKEAKLLFKVEAKKRDPVHTAKLIELKRKYQEQAAKDLPAAIDGQAALAEIFLAHWPKVYHQLQAGRRTGVTWQAGGKANGKPLWVKNGKRDENYHVEELVGQ